MRWGIGALFSLIAICCAGCASQPAALIVATVAPGQAKITIMRTDTPACLIPCLVQIDANGKHLAELGPGQSYTGGVPHGPVTLTLSQTADIGHYKLEFNATAGKTYAFEVSQRVEPKVAAVLML